MLALSLQQSEARANDVLRLAFAADADAIIGRSEMFGEDTYATTIAAVQETRRTLSSILDERVRLHAKHMRENVKQLDARHEMAKQVAAALQVLADLCEAAMGSAHDLAVHRVGLAEARRGRGLAAIPCMTSSAVYDIGLEATLTDLFEVAVLDDTGATCDVESISAFLPRGEHSFMVRMAPLNAKVKLHPCSRFSHVTSS